MTVPLVSDTRQITAILRLGIDTAPSRADLRDFWTEHAHALKLVSPTQYEWLRAAANARRIALGGTA